ncbi:MAG: flagellar basal-body MS-ring/collar protein FliF [bacterium]|nr:flagellar basal-body MS-ring/collar protein FliF [bacterium]
MKFDIAGIFEQLVASYAKMPLAQKVALPLLVAASMGVIVFISRWAGEPEYRTLYSGLESGDAAAVVEYLKDNKVAYLLSDNGGTIKINPPEMVEELKLELASAGLPKEGTKNFELLSENAFGRTSTVEKEIMGRVREGELERTIKSIEAVSSVRVHITEPKRSLFVKRDVSPTASVLLKLKPAAELTAAQVKGIVNLVSGAVERLTPENVTILDSSGRQLNNRPEEDSLQDSELTRLEYKKNQENQYSQRIESMLAEVLGPGRAVARVTLDLDFNQYEKSEEAFDPSGVVTRSERIVMKGDELTAQGGVPGVVSNLTNDPGILTPPDSGSNKSRQSESVRNYEVSRSLIKTVTAVGGIERLTVAVLVDGTYSEVDKLLNPNDTELVKVREYTPLPPEMMDKITKLVKQAVGFQTERGDLVTVENIRFFEPDNALVEALDKAETTDMYISWLPMAAGGALILLFFLLVIRPVLKFLLNPTDAEVDLSRLLPSGLKELEAELDAERTSRPSLPQVVETGVDLRELEELLAENSRLVENNPQQAALLIRYWLNDGRG